MAARKWIKDPTNEDTYIRMVKAREKEIIESVQEMGMCPYVETKYQAEDYVLRKNPATKVGQRTKNNTDRGIEALIWPLQPYKCPSSMDSENMVHHHHPGDNEGVLR